MMKLALSLAFAASLLTVGCSDVLAPAEPDPNITLKSSKEPSVQAVFAKYDGLKGNLTALEEALDIYSGTGSETCGLILPAVQQVREAASSMDDDTDRDGYVDVKIAERTFRVMILSHNPTGTAYKLKDVIVTSLKAHGTETSGNTPDLKPYGKNDAGNVEANLYHIFNGMRLELEDNGVDDRTIDAALDALFDEIADLSTERPQA